MRRSLAIMATLLLLAVPATAHQASSSATYTMPAFPPRLIAGDVMVAVMVYDGNLWQLSTGSVMQSVYTPSPVPKQCSTLPMGPLALAPSP